MVELSDPALDTIFHALSDPTRRAIVARLARGDCSISVLAEPFEMSFAAISKHVGRLEEAELVKRRVEGRTHVCSLEAATLAKAHRWLGAYELFWSERLDALESLLIERRGQTHDE
jgi:DNA-binding transcriptional ArsR family regulator